MLRCRHEAFDRSPHDWSNSSGKYDAQGYWTMTPERADWHLWNWCAYMGRNSYAFLKVRLMSIEANRSYGSQDFDNMAEAADMVAAKATNAVVSDLPTMPKAAVNAFYLGHPWNHRPLLSQVIPAARELVGAALERKGFV